MKVFKAKLTRVNLVIFCSFLIVMFFIFRIHGYSSLYVTSAERSILAQPIDKVLSARLDIYAIKSDVNTNKSVENTNKSVENTNIPVDNTNITVDNTNKLDLAMNKPDLNSNKSYIDSSILKDNKVKAGVTTLKSVTNTIKLNDNMKADDNESYSENVLNKAINRTLWTRPPKGTLLSRRQIGAIKKVLPANGNLLVWGVGNDSPFWHYSTGGKVIFIEPEGKWLNKTISKYPFLETYQIKYTTSLFKTFDRYINNSEIWTELDLRSQLPPVVRLTPWDVILVDAPLGFGASNPGRYQSIYTSSLIAQNGTHVFVDDFERKVERHYSLKMLGVPVEVVNRVEAMNITRGNQLAHFYHIHTKH